MSLPEESKKKGGCLTTTTLIENLKPLGSAFFAGDESHDVANGLELLCLIVWNFNVEFLFESHDELDGVEGVGTEVLNELSSWGYLVGANAELVYNDFLNAFFDRFV